MHRGALHSILAIAATLLLSAAPLPQEKKPSLKQAIAQLPPPWMASTTINWDTRRPWKEARLEIRRLLAGTPAEVRQGVKLTHLYLQKNDIGDGHEWPLYLFLSGQYAWAAAEYPKYLQRPGHSGPTHAYQSYASCLAHFGEYAQALAILDRAMKDLPAKPWTTVNTAKLHEQYGDLHVAQNNLPKARQHYAQAMQIYPTSDQPYGRHLLPRHVARVRSKLDLLDMASLEAAALRDGVYVARAQGYSDKKELEITVTIRGGRIADIKVAHEEKIELNATRIVPQRIIDKQSLKVDALTGATVTSQGIIEGTFTALKQAGLKK